MTFRGTEEPERRRTPLSAAFSPYTSTPTNLLFFDRTGPTREIWYYQVTPPPGMKRYSKTKPLKFEEFKPLPSWWHERTENEHALRVPVEDVLILADDGTVKSCNLDLRSRPPS
jgi:type I restriction enzyme M protein